MVMCAGAFLHIVAPGCTLASSPAFADALEEAMVSAPDWVAECWKYKDGLDQTVVSGLVAVLSKNLAAQTGSDEVNTLIDKAQAADDPGEKARLEAAIVSATLVLQGGGISKQSRAIVVGMPRLYSGYHPWSCSYNGMSNVLAAIQAVLSQDEEDEQLLVNSPTFSIRALALRAITIIMCLFVH